MAEFRTFATRFIAFNPEGQMVWSGPEQVSPRAAPGGDLLEVSWGGFERTDKETGKVSVSCSLWVRKNWWRDATPRVGNDPAAPFGRYKNTNPKPGKDAAEGFGPLKGWPDHQVQAIFQVSAQVIPEGRAAAAALAAAA